MSLLYSGLGTFLAHEAHVATWVLKNRGDSGCSHLNMIRLDYLDMVNLRIGLRLP